MLVLDNLPAQKYHYDGTQCEMVPFFEEAFGFKVRSKNGIQELIPAPEWGEGLIQRFPLESGLEIWTQKMVFSRPFSCTYSKSPYSVFGCWNEGPMVSPDLAKTPGYMVFDEGTTNYVPGVIYDYEALVFNDGFFDNYPEFRQVFNSFSSDFNQSSLLSFRLASILEQVNGCKKEGLSLRFFMEGKALELLSELLRLHEAFQENAEDKTDLSRTELVCIKRAHEIIEKNPGKNITLPELAILAGVNTTKLTRGFKKLYGMSVNSYRTKVRMEKAGHLLLHGSYNISETAWELGYKSSRHFSETFRHYYNISPGEYRRGSGS